MSELKPNQIINNEESGKIRATIRRTLNLGDYNSISYELSMEESIMPGAPRSKAAELMFEKVNQELGKKLKKDGHLD